jgi:hypothetical protein
VDRSARGESAHSGVLHFEVINGGGDPPQIVAYLPRKSVQVLCEAWDARDAECNWQVDYAFTTDDNTNTLAKFEAKDIAPNGQACTCFVVRKQSLLFTLYADKNSSKIQVRIVVGLHMCSYA